MKNFIFISVFCLALASCSFDSELLSRHAELASEEDSPCEIILSSNSLTAVTRAEGDNLPAGSKVYVWADRSDDASAWINAWTLTADGSGGLSGDAKYFPADASSLDFYAFTGSFSSTPSAWGSFTHQVASDQTATASMNASDLLYAVHDDVEPRGKSVTVPLNFYHLLAKVRVALSIQDEDDDLTGSTLQIVNGGGSIAFNPAKVTADEMETLSVRTAMLGTQSSATDVELPMHYTVASGNDAVTYGEAIVIPQRYAGVPLLTITRTNGESLSFKPDDFSLVSGSMHTLLIDVESGSGKLYIRGAITPWNEGSLEGDPSPELIEGETTRITPWKTGSIEGDDG